MKKPDELVAEIDRSILAKALVASIAAHAILMGATSIGLFQDWAHYGVHSPSYINAQKTRERRDAEELQRQQAALEKAKKEAAEAEARKQAAATNKTAQASAPAKAADTVAAEEAKEAEKKTPPEVQPLPPKTEFKYGDDLTLD